MEQVLEAVALGTGIGLALGTLGGGGSILAVPALVYLLGQTPHQATSMSLVVVGIGALGGLAGHWHGRRVRFAAGAAFGAVGIVGSLIGSRLNRAVDGDLLLVSFAVLMLAVSVPMWRRAGRGGSDGPPAVRARGTTPASDRLTTATVKGRWLRVAAWGTAVGLLTGLFGVGGGFVIVPALTLVLGFPMPVAVGTSLVVIAVNVVAALTGRIGSLDIDWMVTAAFAAGTFAGSALGARVAGRLAPARLAQAFSVVLVTLGAFVIVRSGAALI